jgi:tetratricopeptide (TPR) repeat protein
MRSLVLSAVLPLLFPAQETEKLAASAAEKIKSGDFDGAIADLTKAIDQGARRADLYRLRGAARYYSGDSRSALSDLSEGPEDPIDAETLTLRGSAYFTLEAWADALRDFRAACRADGSRETPLVVPIWLARAHAGERDAATRETLKQAPKGWNGRLATFLAGGISQEELLKEAGEQPGATREDAEAEAWVAVAERRRLDGKDEPELLRKALKLHRPSREFQALVSGHLAFWEHRERRRILDLLEERFRLIPRFHAEFRFQTFTEAGEEVDKDNVAELQFDLDRPNHRLLCSIPKGGAKAPDGMLMYFDKVEMTAWAGEGPARRMLYATLFEPVDKWEASALAEIKRLLPPEAAKALTPSVKQMHVMIQLEGKPGPDQEGTFRFAVGRGSTPSSWTRDGIRYRDTSVRVEDGDTIIDMPSRKKRIVLDRDGFLKSLEARDYDGKRRRLVRTAFTADAPFPVVNFPDRIQPIPVDTSVQRYWYELQLFVLSPRLRDVLLHWDGIKEAGKEKEATELFVAWVTQFQDTLHTFNVQNSARTYIKWLLDQGQKWDDIKDAKEEHLKNYMTWAAQGRAPMESWMRSQLEELERRVTAELVEEPIDSRLHPPLRGLRKAIFDFEKIEPVRRRGDNEKAGRIFREELEAARRP